MLVDGFPSLHHVFIEVNAGWLVKVERVLHLSSGMVLGNKQSVHVPARRLNVIVNQFGETHLKENGSNALDERLHGMAAARSRRGRFKGDVKGTELSRFPILTLQQFRRDVGDDHRFLQIVGRHRCTCFGQSPVALGALNGLNQVLSTRKMLQHVIIGIVGIEGQGLQERRSLPNGLGDDLGVAGYELAAFNADTELLEQADARSSLMAFKGRLETLHGRRLLLLHPSPQPCFEQPGFNRLLAGNIQPNFSKGFLRNIDQTVVLQTVSGTDGHRLIGPIAGCQDAFKIP